MIWRAVLCSGLAATVALLAGCTATPATPAAPPQAPAPPPPPAACLLDTTALATTAGLIVTPDATTASDTRCVYDTGSGSEFLAVDIAPAQNLDVVAELCVAGTRTPVGVDGFVCRFLGESVFAARVRDGQLVTVSASAVPAGTTADLLAAAFTEQLLR